MNNMMLALCLISLLFSTRAMNDCHLKGNFRFTLTTEMPSFLIEGVPFHFGGNNYDFINGHLFPKEIRLLLRSKQDQGFLISHVSAPFNLTDYEQATAACLNSKKNIEHQAVEGISPSEDIKNLRHSVFYVIKDRFPGISFVPQPWYKRYFWHILAGSLFCGVGIYCAFKYGPQPILQPYYTAC